MPINVLLSALDLDQRDLAALMGYRDGYVRNVLGGHAPASPTFRRALGDAIVELLIPSDGDPRFYPAGPLRDLIYRRAEQASDRTAFYERLGIARSGLNTRVWFDAATVDRVCCTLGVHPSALYGLNDSEAAS